MKPKLKPDVYWVPQGDTLAFIHPGDPLTVRGRSALPLMDRLAPYLDGTVHLDDLVGGLPEAKRDMVLTLVTALSNAGLVKDVQDDEPHPLSDALMQRYAAEIAYIDHHLSSAGRRFHTFRTTRVTCVGAGMSLGALARALLRAGVADLTVQVTADCDTDLNLLDRYAAQAHEGDPEQRMTRHTLGGSDAELREAVAGADLVLHVSDRPVLARARDLDRLCRENGRPLIQGIVVQDQAWTGPVSGDAGAGWESAWRRVWSNQPHPAGSDPFPAEPAQESQFLAGPTASIVGNRVGFLAFQYVTGVAAARAGVPPSESLTVVDLETLDTTEHPLLAHPATDPAGPETETEAAQRFTGMLAWPAPEPGAFSKAAAELFDARVGPMRSLDEADLTQLPLHLAEVTVADPFGLLDTSDGHPTAVGFGDSFAAARHDGALRAFELYATLAVDSRRLVHADGADHVFARDLATGGWELINAHLAYPVLTKPGPAQAFTRPLGLAAAPTGAEALRQALLQHCAALAADAVHHTGNTVALAGAAGRAGDTGRAGTAGGFGGEGVFPELAFETVELSGTAALYRDAARTALPGLRAYDLSAVCGVPVLAWCDGDDTLAYTAGSDLAEAITSGLLQALLHYQAADSGQTRLAPPAPPPLPRWLRGDARSRQSASEATPGHAVSPATGAPVPPAPGQAAPATGGAVVPAAPSRDWQDLVAALNSRGHRVLALAVGHDRLVAQVLPTVVRVVLR